MMIVPAGVKVHLALGYTDMRKGMDGLAMLVQDTLKKDALSGHLFAFRGKRARIIKILFWDGRPCRRWHSRWHASVLPCRARAAQSIGSPSKARFPGSRQSVWCSRLQLPPMRSRVGFRIGAWLVSAQGSVRSTKARKANPSVFWTACGLVSDSRPLTILFNPRTL